MDRRSNQITVRALHAASIIAVTASGTFTFLLWSILTAANSLKEFALLGPEHKISIRDNFIGKTDVQGAMDYLSDDMWKASLVTILFLASLIAVCVLAGRADKAGNGEIKLTWYDRMWSELQFALFAGGFIGAGACMMPIYELYPLMGWFNFFAPAYPNKYWYSMRNESALLLCIMGIVVGSFIGAASLSSMAKKIKAGEFLSRSVIINILKFVWKWAKIVIVWVFNLIVFCLRQIWNALIRCKNALSRWRRSLIVPADADKHAVRKLMLRYIGIATFLIAFSVFAAFAMDEGWFFVMLLCIATACVLIIRKINKFAEIRAGVIAVKSGDLSHKISVLSDVNGPVTDMDKLADDINQISETTNVAVRNEIKNQRLKADLISNVSHDLKTPLTSLISYIDILEKDGLKSKDAPEHLNIIKEKAERLRVLTDELFEAAKAASGSMPCEISDIDVSALIDQSLAEMEDRLNAKKLDIRKSTPEEAAIARADGRLLYRVFENLLSNISKYALDGSRVYIDVSEAPASGSENDRDRLLIEVKNISSSPLNISEEELMERFTRGDKSRTTEGSGLGLAIAKDLTSLMGGVFEITIDGDMFKASLLLDKVATN